MAKQLETILPSLIKLRHKLHQNAELSGSEKKTAEIISAFLNTNCKPDHLFEQIGGSGIVAVFRSKSKGPVLAFRSELDALPIDETLPISHASKKKAVSHKCGHDGHMTILCGLAKWLSEENITAGKVVLIFQPAEETGEGARLMMKDSRFKKLKPDFIFALHNLPGYPLHKVVVGSEIFSCASSGLSVRLNGQTSHAAHPEKGRNPALAVADLITALDNFSNTDENSGDFSLVTIVHVRIGELAFGTSPGEGEVLATLRAQDDETLAALKQKVTRKIRLISINHKLEAELTWQDNFSASNNHPDAVKLIEHASEKCAFAIQKKNKPFRWSEDFGQFTRQYKGALFGLGAGEKHPELHRQDYDFPDELLLSGVKLFRQIILDQRQERP